MAREGRLAFGTFELDMAAGELRKRGVKLKLQGKPLAVLAMLLENAGEIVTREQLRRRLWSDDTFVDFDHSLALYISDLRKALGDTAVNPIFIETLPRRGYRFLAPMRQGVSALPTKQMVAVLPFENLSQDAEQEYFSDGLTEEMIGRLGGLHPQRLGVIARTSSMRYKRTQKSISEIGEELGVRYVLEGSVRRSARRVRIAAQLIRVSDQTHVWAESYDCGAADLIDVQVDVAAKIATALAVELLPGHDPTTSWRPVNLEAHELYLRGRYLWAERTDQSALQAIPYFERAASADPSYALAYTGIADCNLVLGLYGILPPGEAFRRAKMFAHKALSLAPTMPQAQSTMGFCLLHADWDWPSAEREHLQAIDQNPNCSPAYHWYGISLTHVGRFEDADAALERALELDPFAPAIHAHRGRVRYYEKDFPGAARFHQKALELNRSFVPARYLLAITRAQLDDLAGAVLDLESLVHEFGEHHPLLLSSLACSYGRSGKPAEARKWVARLQKVEHGARIAPYLVASALAWQGNEGEVLQLLEEAYAERSPSMLTLRFDPLFAFLSDDPRMRRLCKLTDVGAGRANRAAAE